jgi:phosphoribosylaminoimidazole (AIR) synthetase
MISLIASDGVNTVLGIFNILRLSGINIVSGEPAKLPGTVAEPVTIGTFVA